MKNSRAFRRFASVATASLLAACMAVPMAATNVSAASITITGISAEVTHTFEVYQVFTGDLDNNGILSNMKWGSGVTKYDGIDVTAGAAVTETIITEITEGKNATATVAKLTLGTVSKTVTSTNNRTAVIDDLDDGYYVVKDTTNLAGQNDANSTWIVQVAGNASVEIKNALPTVEKQVSSGENFADFADYAINETFQFKLTAEIPNDPDLAAYEKYALTFTDTLSAGITFDGIASVTVNDNSIAATDYTVSSVSNEGLFTVAITDLIPLLEEGDTLGNDTVVVTYNAHLNENAAVNNATGTTTNKNDVTLTYTNSPDSTGEGTTGTTPSDSAWVFTYQVNNTKYANSVADANKLAGAGFTLYKGNTAIKLIDNGDGSYTVADQSLEQGVITEMTSFTGGIFNIKGLDAGEYTLKETSTPAGYNTCADTKIVIDATLANGDNGPVATLSADSNMDNNIINKSGSSLPSTGGIGTTVFYLAGGIMVAVAGIYLISKKRMNNVQD